MRSVSVCRRCRKSLVAAPPVDREGRSNGVRIRVQRLPARRCPAGCPGTYWGHADVAAQLFEALTGGAEWVLPRRRFGRSCPRCSGHLSSTTHPGRLRVVIPHAPGPATMLEIEAPVLDCGSCDVSFLDAAGQVDSIREALVSMLENNLLRVAGGEPARA